MARALPALLVAVLLACWCTACGAGGSGQSSAVPTGSSGFEGAALPPGTLAPPFALTDQRGRTVALSDYRGRVVVLAFVYARCGAPCMLVAQQVRGALDELATPPAVVFLSAAPRRDDPASVAAFLARASLTGRVEYLSGPPAPLRAALRAYRVTPARPGARFEPPASLALVDGAGHERVLFGLEQLTPESLAHDIRALQGAPGRP